MNTALADAMKSGVDDTLVPALEDTSKAVGQGIDSVAEGGTSVIGNVTRNESELTGEITSLRPGDPPARIEDSGPAPDNKFADVLGGGGDDAGTALGDQTREMSAKEPSQGWGPYKDLSPKAKNLSRSLDDAGPDGAVDIKPGEVGTSHLAELTKYYDGEVGVVQGPAGDLKLIRGGSIETSVPDDLFSQGYRFVVHTHPEDLPPGYLSKADQLMGKTVERDSSIAGDVRSRMNSASTRTEAIVNRSGDVTYINHEGVVPVPEGGVAPGGPINGWGFVFPVPSL